jgi:hypothetical protein
MPRDQRSIRELAHRLWEARGCPEGSPERDWLDAEHQFSAAEPAAAAASAQGIDDALKDTFPASDPPASHLPDKPPANAGEKWAAAAALKASTLPTTPARMRRSPGR